MKPERRMKKTDFVKINSDYGPDVSKGVKLPAVYIYFII